VTDWRSATATMRFLSIDNYLADLNVLVDQLGAKVDLVGLCQGGWLALIFAARFPAKVRKLVLAGAPIDIEAGDCALTRLARGTPTSLFREFVEVGEGRVLGRHSLEFWGPRAEEREAIHRVNEDEVIQLLRAAVEREGNQIAFARRHGLERSGLNMILNGKRPVTSAVVKALGLRKVYAQE
jgi:pimeloyl-ACP methyl ester carboxylesterase